MRLNSILGRYIFREMMAPFAVSIGFFSFIFMMAQMLDITNLVVNYEVGLGAILRLVFYTLPMFLVYVIPMSVMTAVLLAFMRLSGDNEIVAVKAGGGSLYGLLPPVLLFGALGCALAAFMALFASPRGLTAGNRLAYQIAVSHADIGLKERTFSNSFSGVMLYVGGFSKQSGELVDIFIEDQREKDLVSTVIAPRGRLFSDPRSLVYVLRLSDGTIVQTGVEKRSVNSVRFETYDIRLDLNQALPVAKYNRRKRPMMHLGELRQYVRDQYSAGDLAESFKGMAELHKRFALPVASLALGLLAVPIGIQARRSKRSTALVVALAMFLFYYLLLTGGVVGAESGLVAPWIGMWLPNLVMGLLGLFLLVRTVRERPLEFRLPRIG